MTRRTNIPPATIGHRWTRGGGGGDSAAVLDWACAASAILAARRAASGTDWLGLSSRAAGDEPLAAPAAASSGWVTVASKARLRAALQSRHSFAPGRLNRPQIRHFIAFASTPGTLGRADAGATRIEGEAPQDPMISA